MPSSLADFEILGRLGKGNFGTVYQVKRLEDGQVYCMKQMDLNDMTPTEQGDAVREVHIMASAAAARTSGARRQSWQLHWPPHASMSPIRVCVCVAWRGVALACLQAALEHEHVVRYYDSFIERGVLCIVMEYCNRGDLQV